MLKTRKIYRAGREFQVPENNMCSLRFKGGSGRQKLPKRPTLGAEGKELQAELFPIIERGLRGEGLTPDLQGRSMRDMLAATTEEFQDVQGDLSSVLTRTIPKADFAVRDFIRKSIDASFARTKEGIRDEFATTGFEDKNIAQNLAFNALATEKGVAAQFSDLYNQSQLRRSQSPTFGSELAGGLGGAAGILAGGYQQPSTASPWAQGMNAAANQWLAPQSPAINYSKGFSELPLQY